ncbi:MAG TPA: ATP-binding protein [Candidatus Methylomirabilis sp.]|nr:ATP-binding protein [Candidatus Methylomirabilis sp.]
MSDNPVKYALTQKGFERYKSLKSMENELDGAYHTFEEFLKLYYWDYFLECVRNHDLLLKIRFSDIERGLGLDFAESLMKNPKTIMEKLNQHIKQIVLPIDDDFRPVISIDGLYMYRLSVQDARKKDNINKLIEVEGRIMVQSDIRPVYHEIAYKCMRCGDITCIPQERGKRIEPFICGNEVCNRRGPFRISIEDSTLVDSQDIILESTQGNVHLSVVLDHPLCTSDFWERDAKIVRIVGILELRDVVARDKPDHADYVLIANSIEIGDDNTVLPPTEEEIILFEEWAKNPRELREMLINDIAPHIYGMHAEKDALCCSLFSDWTWNLPAKKTLVRSSLHILLIGDPGAAKTELIKDIIKHAPKGLMGQGENATGKGLSNAAVLENGIWIIKAGLFAKGDGGLIGLDELDKIDKNDLNSLNSILVSQQQIVDKAGKHVTFDTRCAAICAANPKNGHIDKYDPIIRQLGLSSFLFQRFDLVFVVVDTPDRFIDSEIYDRISETCDNSPIGDIALNRKIQLDIFKKYVIYARCKPVPKMTGEANEILKHFYLEARNLERKENYPAINHRTAAALNKLAKTIARRELAPEVTAEHAQYAVNLYRKSIISVGMGEEDMMSLETGGARSQFKRIEDIRNALLKSKESGLSAEKVAEETSYPLSEVIHTLDKMKENGEIIEYKNICKWVENFT